MGRYGRITNQYGILINKKVYNTIFISSISIYISQEETQQQAKLKQKMYQNSFSKLGLIILVVSTFKVLFPMRRIEYYFLKFKKSFIESRNKQNKTFQF